MAQLPFPLPPPPHDLGTLGKPSMSKGSLRQFHNVQTYGARIIEDSNILSMKIQKDQN